MRPVLFPVANKVLQKPANLTDEQCSDLEIFNDGVNCVSCWELNKEELELIQQTGRIYVVILSGITQPPMHVHVESPFITPFP